MAKTKPKILLGTDSLNPVAIKSPFTFNSLNFSHTTQAFVECLSMLRRRNIMNCTRIFALIALLGLASELPAASNGSANVSSACATVEFMGKMISLNILLPADYDDINALYDMQDSLAELNLLVC
jgi:hypothetical protein